MAHAVIFCDPTTLEKYRIGRLSLEVRGHEPCREWVLVPVQEPFYTPKQYARCKFLGIEDCRTAQDAEKAVLDHGFMAEFDRVQL